MARAHTFPPPGNGPLIPVADESRIGLWMNGSQIPHQRFLWFLIRARVPCFFIEESTDPDASRAGDALRSVLSRTPLESLVVDCFYDVLANRAGGIVITMPSQPR